MTKFKRILLIAVAVLVALAIAAYVAVRVAFPPEKIAEIVRVEGTKALGRQVNVGSVGIGIFPRVKVGVRDVSLANDSGFSAEPALSLKRLDLTISLWSLIRFSPVINEVRLVEPDILFEVDANGRNNLESLGDTTATPEDTTGLTLPTSLALRAFVIEDGRVRYRDAHSARTITLGRINQRASLSLDPRLTDVRTTGTLDIAEISVQDAALGFRKGGVKISVSHDLRADIPGDSLRINAVDIAFQDVKAHIAGLVTGMTSDAPVADVRASAPRISLASLFAEIPPELSPEIRKLKVKGTASLEARIAGVLDSNALKAVRADLQVRDASFRHDDVPQGVEGFNLSLAVRGDSVRLDSMTFHSGPNPFRVEALATGLLDPVPYLRSLKAGGELDLGNLAALARKMELLDPNIQVSGRQTLRLTASGPLDAENPQRLAADGRAEFIGVKISVPEFPPLEFRGTASINNEIVRQQLTARIGKSDASVNTVVTNWLALVMPEQAEGSKGSAGRRTAVKVDVRSSLIDLDELLPKSGAEADSTEPLTAYPEWPPVDADVTVTLARTRLMNLDMTGFSLKTVLRAQSAVTDLKGALYTGGFASTVTVVPRDTMDWGIGFKLKVDKVEANDFISRLNDRVPLRNKMLRSLAATDSAVFGKFNLDLDLTTRGLPAAYADNLSGPIAFSLTDGRIVGVAWTRSLSGSLAKAHSSLGFEQLTFSALKGEFVAHDGKLHVNDFSFDSPGVGAARASGRIGFDNTLDLQLAHALPPTASKLVSGVGGAVLSQLQKLAPGSGVSDASLFPMDKEGRVLFYYKVEGELSSPRISLDAKRMAAAGSGNAAKNAALNALHETARQKQAELAARAAAERAKLEAEAKARVDAEKARLQTAADAEAKRLKDAAAAEKKRLEEKAAEEARKKRNKVLEDLRK